MRRGKNTAAEFSDFPIGAHHSIAGGTPRAVERALSTGSRVLQIFVKNSNRWVGKEIDEEEAESFRSARAKAGLLAVAAHSSYRINAAGSNAALCRRSTAALADELGRCERLGVPALVLHPGSCGESGVARDLDRDRKNLARPRTLARDSDRTSADRRFRAPARRERPDRRESHDSGSERRSRRRMLATAPWVRP